MMLTISVYYIYVDVINGGVVESGQWTHRS